VEVEPDLDKAFVFAAVFLDPILSGRASGAWDPQRESWA